MAVEIKVPSAGESVSRVLIGRWQVASKSAGWYNLDGHSWVGSATVTGTTMKELGLDRLTRQQRIDLAMEIWESLGDDRPGGRLTPEQRSELHRRDAEMDAHPERVLTLEQVLSGIRSKAE